jgi:RimJ/RimL family protein N-acetyltransferase
MSNSRHSRASGGPISLEESRGPGFRGKDELARPMSGDDCRAELFSEQHRDALRAACAEDGDIWRIYANDFGPEGFDRSIDLYIANPNNRTFLLFDGDELAGMSSFLGIDEARQVLEIGGTYYRPHLRGTGFNRRVKDMMLERAFDCGIRRVEFRVDLRNGRSQAAMKKLGAVREGVLRADRITWTGHVRDTVLFSMLKDEWPL